MRGDAVIDAVVGDFTSMYLRWDGVLARFDIYLHGVLGMHWRFIEKYNYRTFI